MSYGMYLSAAGMMTNMYRQDVTANNLANISTTGFKRDMAMFSERLTESQKSAIDAQYSNVLLEKLGGGTFARMDASDHTDGQHIKTDNTLDMAIKGKGFFVVQATDGTDTALNLTRDGRFSLNEDKQLVTTIGEHVVMSIGNQPIYIDDAFDVHVNDKGEISQDGVPIAQLKIANPEQKGRMRHLGQGMYSIDPIVLGNTPISEQATVKQGFIEASNVSPVKELLAMIEATRAITNNSTMMKHQDAIIDRAVNVLGRVG